MSTLAQSHAPVQTVAVFTSERWDSAVVQLRLRSPFEAAGMRIVRGYVEADRAPNLDCIAQADAVLIHRDFPRHADAYTQVVQAARAHHKPMVFEIDDLMWDMPADHPVADRYRDIHDPLVEAACHADLITTTTEPLAARLRAMNPNTFVLPNCIDPATWSINKPANVAGRTPIVIGYMGSGTHGPDLQMIEPAVKRILQAHPHDVVLELINEMPTPALAALPNVRRLEGTPDYSVYARMFDGRQWDIAIAPLRDTPFNRGKSGLKYLEFGMIGAAGIYSDVTPYRNMVTDGRTGFLAASVDDWEHHLNLLIGDAALRHQIACASAEDIRNQWLIGQRAHLWQAAYAQAGAQPRTELPNVSVIVLTHNGKQHLDECFGSLLRQDYTAAKLELVLADNASSDGSPDYARQKFPRVRVHEMGSNVGFCVAYNRAIAACTSEYVALLNDDMRVEPDWLIQLVRAVQCEPDARCAGSKILTWDGTAVDFAGHEYSPLGYATGVGYGERDLNAHDDQRYIFAASGGSMLIRRDAFLEVGGLDESFFAYFEDLDLGWRLWAAGYKTVYAPKSMVYHKHFSTWSRSPGPRVAHLYERNMLYALIKNADQPFFERALLPAILMRIRLAYLNGRSAGLRIDQIRYTPGQAQPNQPQQNRQFGANYYATQAKEALRHGGPLGLARKLLDELDRRRGAKPPQTLVQTELLDARLAKADINELLSQDAFWHEQAVITALNDVVERYDVLMAERAKLQARRKMSDNDIFALTKAIVLRPWFDDPAYQRSHRMLLECFGLNDLFQTAQNILHKGQES